MQSEDLHSPKHCSPCIDLKVQGMKADTVEIFDVPKLTETGSVNYATSNHSQSLEQAANIKVFAQYI